MSATTDPYSLAAHTYIVSTLENVSTPAIVARYTIPNSIRAELETLPSPLISSAYRYTVYLRTYSRLKPDGSHEQWIDTVIRVIEGTMSCYINHMRKNGLYVDNGWVDQTAAKLARSLYLLQWSPPGRGLFAMGTDHMYHNGNASLNNCYAVDTTNLVKAAAWTMDMSMNGGGVGFDTSWDGIARRPDKTKPFVFVVPDSRQGWVAALELLIRAYVPIDGIITNGFPTFDFSLVRPYGAPIKSFGGTASGPEPLRVLLHRVEIFFDTYLDYQECPSDKVAIFDRLVRRQHEVKVYNEFPYDLEEVVTKVRDSVLKYEKPYDITRLIVDLFNAIGKCIVSGGVRRTAMIAISNAGDATFLDLKNPTINPEREPIAFISNNTVRFWTNDDFDKHLSGVVDRIRQNGEPGIANMINVGKYGRITDTRYGPDLARLLNPCGEQFLESFDSCNLSSVCPYNCRIDLTDPKSPIDERVMLEAAWAANFFALVVTTVRHHWYETNAIIAKNRRIGVSYSGVANIYENYGCRYLISTARRLYAHIRSCNDDLSKVLGIPRSIRVTTIKPEGTLSIMMGVAAGAHFPICRFAKRRVGIENRNRLLSLLGAAGYVLEPSCYNANMTNVIFPISSEGARAASSVSIYEKFNIAVVVQRHFSDNSVSFTGDFHKTKEAEDISRTIIARVGEMKSLSALPYGDEVYKQMPFEEIEERQYGELMSAIRPVKWNDLDADKETSDVSRDGVSYCTGDSCLRLR